MALLDNWKNPYLPASYPSAQQQTSPMIWVKGENEAKNYPMAPNSTVQLWDSEDQVIYLKSTDASGMPSMKILDYTIRDRSGGNYVTKDDLKALETKLLSMMRKEAPYA